MSGISTRVALAPEGRVAFFYLLAFSISGAMGAYFGIWMQDRGLSGGDIGWINAAPILLTLVLNIHVGRLADRARDWRDVIIVACFLTAIFSFGLFLISDFWSILIVVTLWILPFSLITPVLDAASMRLARRNGTNFALLRAGGSVGYIVALGVASLVIALWGAAAYLPLLVVLTLVRAGASLVLPRFKTPTSAPLKLEEMPSAPQLDTPPSAQPTAPPAAHRLIDVLKPWFVAPILAFALVQGLHFVLNAFSGVIWRANGIHEAWVGPLLAIGTTSEVIAMVMFKRFAARFTARHLILVAVLVSAVRWGLMALNPPIWALALLQTTHSITFGVSYLGLMNFIANWTSEDIAAEAQSFATVVQMGMIVIALSVFGYLVDAFGIHAFFAGVAFSLLAAGFVWWSLRTRPKAEAQSDA